MLAIPRRLQRHTLTKIAFNFATRACFYTTNSSDIPCTAGKDCQCTKCRAARIKKRRVFASLSDMECSGGTDCQCSVCKAARGSRGRPLFAKYSAMTECTYRVDCQCAKCKAIRAIKDLARAVSFNFITECTSSCGPDCQCPKCKGLREAKSFAMTICSGDAYCQCPECKAGRAIHAVTIRSSATTQRKTERALSGTSGGKDGGCTGRPDCPCPKCTTERDEDNVDSDTCVKDADDEESKCTCGPDCQCPYCMHKKKAEASTVALCSSKEGDKDKEAKCTGNEDCQCPRCKAMRSSGLLAAAACPMVTRCDSDKAKSTEDKPCPAAAKSKESEAASKCATKSKAEEKKDVCGKSAEAEKKVPCPPRGGAVEKKEIACEPISKKADKQKERPPPPPGDDDKMDSKCKKLTRKKKRIPEDYGCNDDDTSDVKQEHVINCTLIPGDGIGPEMADALQIIFEVAKVPVKFDVCILSEVNKKSMKFEDVVASVAKHKVGVMGNLAKLSRYTKSGSLQTLKIRFRNALDLFVNVVHVRSLPNVGTRHKGIDMIIIREQTEGEYSAIERECVPGVVESLKIITAKKSQRIAKFAFDFATRNNRRLITAVHKANIMKLGDGLFLSSCTEMAKLYPKIEYNAMIVDNTTMQLVSHPKQFDVLVTPNLYGNLIDNLSIGLVGGAGVVPGISYSPDVAIFEAGSHHTFEAAAGKNEANPTAILLCGAAMLRHVHLPTYAEKIKYAIYRVLSDGKVRTRDLGGKASTSEFIREIARNIN